MKIIGINYLSESSVALIENGQLKYAISEERLNRIYPLLDNAKDETAKYYNENPGSYAVVYSTDYIFELLDEIEAKLNRTE